MAAKLFLIDGLNQIFRCYYAPFRSLNAPGGEPTRATYVFTNMLLQLIREQKPDYLALVMDSPEPGFRKEVDATYKAQREPPPEDLSPQISRILQIVESQCIPRLEVPGYEADDILATVACRTGDQDLDVYLGSSDKDLDQVLTPRGRLFDPMKKETIGPAELLVNKGYGPDLAVEIQTLCGDSTDNIAGVKGVGPKKALDLIRKYGSAAEVIAHADELTPAMRENVRAFADKLEATRRLVTLCRDVPLELDLEACRWTGLKPDRLHPIFKELGFGRLTDLMAGAMGAAIGTGPISTEPEPSSAATTARSMPASGQGELFGPPPPQGQLGPATKREYVLVDSPEKFASFLSELQAQPRFAFDTETSSLNPVASRLAGLSFSWEANRGFYLPICGKGRCLEAEPTLAALRPVMADPAIRKIGQNIKFDTVVLAANGVPVAGADFDTMIASFVLDSSRQSHGMDALCRELLGFDPIPITNLIGRGSGQLSFDQVDTAAAAEYSAEDADVTWQLAGCLEKQLIGSGLETLFHETEMPLVEVLAAMELEGVRVDTCVLAELGKELAGRLEELTRKIHDEVGYPFNIDSPKQLATVLFDELKLPVVRKTRTGRSTDAETLASLAADTGHPVPTLVKEYRELVKLKGTYIDTLPQMICARTGRIHAGFNQTSAITGRLSSSDPNLQNIPVRTEEGRRIRSAFVARDADHVLLTADYSQIELRVLAHFCGDQALRAAFAEDRDIHQFVAAQVFGVPIEEVTREQRGRAKAVNFGIIYGQTAFGLSRTTGMPMGEAQRFIDMYFARYPGIRHFIEASLIKARRDGVVSTILGRRRTLADINSRNKGLRQQAERLAVNTIIQGSAADLIKRAMIEIHRGIIAQRRPSRMIIQVHDELVFDVPRNCVEAESEIIQHQMTTALPLEVPIKVDIAWGNNWLESK